MSDLRETPLYEALYRPQLLLGGDRNIMILVLCAAGLLIVVSHNVVSVSLGILVLIPSMFFLRKAAKVDPLLRRVYLRHTLYKAYYQPFSRPWRVSKTKRTY